MRNLNGRSIFICLVIYLLLANTAVAIDYEIIDLGFSGSEMKINNSNQIAGTLAVSPNVFHAFIYDNNTLKDLGTIGANYSATRDINNNGWVVGESGSVNTFLYANNTMKNLGPAIGGIDNRPYGINDIGQIVGTYDPSADLNIYGHAFIYDYNNNSLKDIGTLAGTNSVAYGINNLGQVVGYSYDASGKIRAFLYDDNIMTDIGALGTYSFATGINDKGQIIGHSDAGLGEHAFLYDDGIMTDLGTLGGTHSYASDINNNGQVVGFADKKTQKFHAFLYDSGSMIDLGTLGGDESRAFGINDDGKIVGWSKTNTGEIHAVLWQPSGTSSAPTIDQMLTASFGQTYRPGGNVMIFGVSDRYLLSDGTSWESGAGSFTIAYSDLERVFVEGDILSYYFARPENGVLFQNTDYDSGDHSAQGTLGAPHHVILRARAGSKTGVITGYTKVLDNTATWYGLPRFNYYSAPVGERVLFKQNIELIDATFTSGLFNQTFNYNLTGKVDFTHKKPDTQATSYQINSGHTGYSVQKNLRLPLKKLWTVSISGASYPVIADGRVFVLNAPSSSYGTRLYAIDAKSGAVLWQKNIPGTYYWSAHTYGDNKLYVLNFDGVLLALNPQDGATIWFKQMPGQYDFSSPPTFANGMIYVGGSGIGGTVYAVNAEDGSVKWTASVENGDHSSPAVRLGAVFVSYACNQAYSFDALSGALLRHYSTDCSGGGGKTSVISRPYGLFTRDFDGNLILNRVTGQKMSNYAADFVPAIAIDNRFTIKSRKLSAYDQFHDKDLWSFTGDGTLSSAPIVVNNHVYIGGSSGMLYALQVKTGKLSWTANVGSPILSPDEHNVSHPLTGLAAGEGLIVVPATNGIVAYGN